MTTDRDPAVLHDPALKVTPAMLAAYDVAADYAEAHQGVRVRIIDADVLLEPRLMEPRDQFGRRVPHKQPRNVVEVFIDTTGVIVVGTGRDSTRPLYFACVSLPASGNRAELRVLEAAFEAHLVFHAKHAARTIAAWSTPGPATQ